MTLDRCHLLVDATLEASRPESFVYRTIQEAAAAVPDGTWEAPSVIYLSPDVYWTGGTPTECGLIIEKNWLSLVGLGGRPEDTVIADARGHMVNSYPAGGGANSPAQTMIVNGDGLHLENLTVGNYLNLDLVYPRDPSKNRAKASDVITQAYALASQGNYDAWTVENCRILGRLDTLSFRLKRLYMHASVIEGTKDFIGGGAAAVYEDCLVRIFDTCPMYMAGEQGTLFRRCRFEVSLPDFDTVYLTKFGQQLALDGCAFTGNVRHLEWALEAHEDGKNYARDITLNGEPVRVSPGVPGATLEIGGENEDAFSLATMLGGDDGWDPAARTFGGMKAARPSCLRLTGDALSVPGGKEVCLGLEAWPKGTLKGREVSVTSSDSLQIRVCGEKVFLSGNGAEDVPVSGWVMVQCEGLTATRHLQVEPAPRRAPRLSGVRLLPRDGVFHLSYVLETEGRQLQAGCRQDMSETSWIRSADGHVLAGGGEDGPCLSYAPGRGDGEVFVRVTPRVWGSAKGESQETEACAAAGVCAGGNRIDIPDFRFFPTFPQTEAEDSFGVGTYRPSYAGDETEHVALWEAGEENEAWRYGRGRDGARQDYGLVTRARGAFLRYVRSCYAGPMELETTLCPDKDTGEGFGSANGQYMEILIKYDPVSRTGFGLRIERRPYFANGCEFSLRSLRDGVSRLVSEAVMSCAFMPRCRVTVGFDGERLYARASTTWEELPSMAKAKGIPASVALEARVEDTGFGGMEIHHTGTVPVGNRTLIADLSLAYSLE